jgi:hypothetical protein
VTTRNPKTTYITVSMAVRQTGLSRYHVGRCMTQGLVAAPLTGTALAELRRIRRLKDLGVNVPGIEVILQMRQRILALQAELSPQERHEARPAWVEPEVQLPTETSILQEDYDQKPWRQP